MNDGKKLTIMQQRFIWAYTAFGQETEGKPYLSARAAGCKGKDLSVSATASRWLKMVKIKNAIEGIKAHRQAQLAEKTGYTIEQAHKEYEEDRQFAFRQGQASAAVAATTGKARLYGFDKDAGVKQSQGLVLNFTTKPDDRPRTVQNGPESPNGKDEA